MAKKRVQYTTPLGTLRYPNLREPRAFKEGEEPNFDTGLTFDPKTLKQVKKDLADIAAKLAPPRDADEGPLRTPIGKDKKTKEEFFKAHSNKDHAPIIQDANENDLPKAINPGGGTKARLFVTLEYYDSFGGGITAYLNAVQVAELVERSVKPKFGKLEGGYVYEGEEDEVRPEANAADMSDF